MAEMNLVVSGNVKNGTNILEVKVPAALERSVATGCEIWDLCLGGGATPSQSILFSGMPGAGKTTLMLQMADAITGAGHVCLFNSHEEAVVQIAKACKRLKLRSGFIVGNDVLATKMIAHAKHLQKLAKGRKAKDGSPVQVFVVADSLQALDDGKYTSGATNGNTPLRVAELVTNWCKTKNSDQYGIAVMIGQVTKSGDFAGKQAILHAVDTRVHLRIDIDPKSETHGFRLIETSKNRMGPGVPGVVLRMTAEGLVEAPAYGN